MPPEADSPVGREDMDNPSLPPITPVEPIISKEITVPSWDIQDILPINEYSRPGIELGDVNGGSCKMTREKIENRQDKQESELDSYADCRLAFS